MRCILIFCVLLFTSCATDRHIEVVNWNTYHLFDHRRHVNAASAWLDEQAPDIVALQEVLHVDAKGLRALAVNWGHDHSVMHKEKGYPVALTSSAPIEVVERRVAGFHHGYLHVRTHNLDVFVVHFWPGKIAEAELVASRAKELIAAGHSVLVVGDFNGEIRHDEVDLRRQGHLGKVIDGKRVFDFRITDAFLGAGLLDVVHAHAPSARYTFGSPALIPRWRKDMADVETTRRRIDFVFADEKTAEGVVGARVVTDDATVGRWSDHYPMIVRMIPPGR